MSKINNRKYIIIGPANGIGGWQLYIDARCKHLTENDIEFYLLYDGTYGGKETKLLNIRKANKLDVRMEDPYWYSKAYVRKELKRILEFIHFRDDDDIFIESTSMHYAFWGELIAKETHGQNFAYILHSYTRGMPLAWKKFFSFKYDQNLIAGQSDNTLPELFENFREINIEDARAILAGWDSPICEQRDDCYEYVSRIKEIKEEKYKLIGYFGVLSKKHFIQLCDDIEKYVQNYPNEKFCLIAIGSSGDGNGRKRIEEINEKQFDNLIGLNIPEMYPVPRYFFESLDVCFGSFGSASTAAMACRRTVRFNSDLYLTVQGVVGITAKEKEHWLQPVREETVDDILDEILFGSNYSDFDYDGLVQWKWGNRHHIIDEGIKPFERRKDGYQYYDVMKIPLDGEISWIKYAVFHVLGIDNGRQIAGIIRNFGRKK